MRLLIALIAGALVGCSAILGIDGTVLDRVSDRGVPESPIDSATDATVRPRPARRSCLRSVVAALVLSPPSTLARVVLLRYLPRSPE